MQHMELKEAEDIWHEKIKTLLGQMAAAVGELKKDGTLSAGMGVTEDEMNQAYGIGYQFFQQNKFDKAETIFRALCLLNPLNAVYIQARAATYKMSGKLVDAALLYLLGYFVHPDKIDMAMQSGCCMVEVGRKLHAYLVLNGVHRILKPEKKNDEPRKKLGELVKLLHDSVMADIEAETASGATGGAKAKKTAK
jgi:predicted Zn-dependent protease